MTGNDTRPSVPPETDCQYGYLPLGWSVAVIVSSVTIAAGLKTAPFSPIPDSLARVLWPASWDGWTERLVLLLLTLVLMLKQMDYYYGGFNWSPKSGIFKSVGWATAWEVALDVALAIGGASLLAISVLWPYFWLPTFAAYCLLGWLRCRLTLLRAGIARRGPPGSSHSSVITFFFAHIPFDHDYERLGRSIEGNHKAPGHPEILRKAVFAGWLWSFRVYGLVSVGATMISLFSYNFFPVWLISVITAALAAGILISFSGLTSNYSQRWGEQHFAMYTESC